MFIRIGYRIAKVGNFFLGTLAAIIAMVAFAFGTYSLWDMYMTNQGAFTSSDILKYKPASTSEGDNLTLGELRKINNETVAWITVYGTNIDYPIVQGKDNAKYVNTDIYGEFSLSGSIFLSYENTRKQTSNRKITQSIKRMAVCDPNHFKRCESIN